MFKWLSRKSRGPSVEEGPGEGDSGRDPEPAATTGEVASIVRRWDGVIADVRQRFRSLIEKTAAASDAQLAALGTDLGPLSRSWSPTQHQLHQHQEEISDAWNQISDLLSEAEPPEGVMDREGQKRDGATCELELDYERAYRAAMARAAERLKQQWQGATAERRCLSCNTPLPAVVVISQAVNVPCPSCGAMTLLDPGPGLRSFAAAALFIGQRSAQTAWEAMRRAEARINGYRDRREVPLELLRELESSAREYWTTTLTVEAEQVPELAKHMTAKLEGAMKGVEKTLRQFWQWRQQG